MKIYESVIIVNSSLNEDTQNRIIGRYEELIKKQGDRATHSRRCQRCLTAGMAGADHNDVINIISQGKTFRRSHLISHRA